MWYVILNNVVMGTPFAERAEESVAYDPTNEASATRYAQHLANLTGEQVSVAVTYKMARPERKPL